MFEDGLNDACPGRACVVPHRTVLAPQILLEFFLLFRARITVDVGSGSLRCRAGWRYASLSRVSASTHSDGFVRFESACFSAKGVVSAKATSDVGRAVVTTGATLPAVLVGARRSHSSRGLHQKFQAYTFRVNSQSLRSHLETNAISNAIVPE